jgi:rod shape-determining protein MreD
MGAKIVTGRDVFFILVTLAAGFILQYFPLAEFMNWFVPEWVLLVFIFWQLQFPNVVNFWWVWPLGFLMDVQQSTPLGTSVLGFSVVLYSLQLTYQRLRSLNVAQQTIVVFLLVCSYQLVIYWAILIMNDVHKPLSLWTPAFVSVLVWPWMYLILHSIYQRFR